MSVVTKYAIPVLALSLLIPTALASAETSPGSGAADAYEKGDILRAFRVMEQHLSIDDSHHIVIGDSAYADGNVTALDIEILSDYARYSDRAVDVIGAVGRVNEYGHSPSDTISMILYGFENGKFRNLFTSHAHGPVGQTSEIVYTSYVPVHHGAPGTWCGGSYSDPHTPDYSPTVFAGGSSLPATQYILGGMGYHMTHSYASWNGDESRPRDFTKIVESPNYDYLCDWGAFRNHAAIDPETFWVSVQEYEPNPEIFHYVWPSAEWGLYVIWWHERF